MQITDAIEIIKEQHKPPPNCLNGFLEVNVLTNSAIIKTMRNILICKGQNFFLKADVDLYLKKMNWDKEIYITCNVCNVKFVVLKKRRMPVVSQSLFNALNAQKVVIKKGIITCLSCVWN